MNILKQTVGIDISFKKFDARFGTINTHQEVCLSASKSFKNSLAGFKLFLRWLKKHILVDNIPLVFVMEATGVYYEQLAHFLYCHGYQVAVVLPNKIRNYAKSLESKSKTDSLDAAVITRFGLERQLPLWCPPSENMKTLRDLCRKYHALKTTTTEIKNQCHALNVSFKPHRESFKRKQRLLRFLNRQIALIEKELHYLLKTEPDLARRLKTSKLLKASVRLPSSLSWLKLAAFSSLPIKNSLPATLGLTSSSMIPALKKEKLLSLKGATSLSVKPSLCLLYRLVELIPIENKTNMLLQEEMG